MHLARFTFCLSLFFAIGFVKQTSAAELDESEFNRLHKMLQASPDEPWRTIPWKIALIDAQQTAAKERKPIFVWAMDGHPLGCT